MIVRVTGGNALDHAVLVMFENRSFDNLLGCLYQPGEVASFDGALGKEFFNQIPAWAASCREPEPTGVVHPGETRDTGRRAGHPVRASGTALSQHAGHVAEALSSDGVGGRDGLVRPSEPRLCRRSSAR